jgi:protoporphyrinogen oxidase
VALMEHSPVVIIGAGPAGLTAAYELVKRNIRPIVIEKSNQVGGLARTETYKDYRFDIGGHRFFTHLQEVEQLWQEIMAEKFIKVARLSRIYYQGRYFNYPLNIFNTLSNLGVVESLLILLSYFKAKLWPYPEEKIFEHWVINRFGQRLYQKFFKTYTEKVWGIPCTTIQADWAAQRIKGLSLKTVVSNALFRNNHHQAKTLIHEFHYPVLGPGNMWQRFQELMEGQGGATYFNSEVVRLKRIANRIQEVSLKQGEKTIGIPGENFISSMPLTELIFRLDPPVPNEVLEAAHHLTYRSFILVGLIINRGDLFPDQWIYVHSPEVKVGRIQNFRNWSSRMVPDPRKTSLGMEYFCTEGDEIWRMPDTELLELAKRELVHLGMAEASKVDDGVVFRQPKAYPVYNKDYHLHLQMIQRFLATIENLQTIGRNGLHRYNNQDHSMLTGMLAVENILGANHDLWELNKNQEYLE